MTVTTLYADTSDGSCRHEGAGYDTIHDATASAGVLTANAALYATFWKSGTTYYIYVHFTPFDSSGISASDTISAATYSIYKSGDAANADSQTIGLVQSQQATWNSLGTGDYDQRGDAINNPTEGATRVAYSAGAGTGYMDFTMNATGIGWIARTGETKPASASATGKTQLAIRFSGDMDDSAPTGANYCLFYMADQAGTTNDPKLVVTHAAAVATGNSHNNLLLLGVS